MLDVQIALLGDEVTNYAASGIEPAPLGSGHPYLCPYAAFMAADHPFVIAAVGVEKFWSALCDSIARPDLAADPRFATNALRAANKTAVEAALAAEFGTLPRQAWLDRLAAADIPAAPILGVADALATPQVTHRRMIRRLPLDGATTALIAASPIKADPAAPDGYTTAPGLGEHTSEILRTRLGYTTAAIRRLIDDGVAR